MDEEIKRLHSKNLTDEELSSIKARYLSSEIEKPVGEAWVYWQEVFHLCRDVPKLLDEIDRLKLLAKELEACRIKATD